MTRHEGETKTKHEGEIKTRPEPARRRTFGRWFADTGWTHLVLLGAAGVFLFPFLWMVGASMKTDEEVAGDAWFPSLPHFVAASPYVRPALAPARPSDADEKRWRELMPELLAAARPIVAAARGPDHGVDTIAWDEAAAAHLTERMAARLPKQVWMGDGAAAVDAFRALCTADEAKAALDDRLARVDLSGLQLKTLDARIVKLLGDGIDRRFTVESGAGEIVDGAPGGRLRYTFASASAEPMVLRCDVPIPDDVHFADLHQLILSLHPDDSWHRVDATLDWGGQRWSSTRTSHLAQHRVMAIVFQPPTFDDQTNKAKTWVPLRGGDAPSPAPPGMARLRLIVAPSGTLGAIWAKMRLNYGRAFDAVPFWTYMGNSLALVALTMGGALFSSTFVAYAFARLRWPGRGAALILLLSTMMLPGQVTMIPSFLIWRELGWYNTLNPLWVPSWFGSAFFIFLMIQQMKTIPRELEEAACIDGMNRLQIWWYIIVPQVKPTLAGIAIMSFIGAWNEFMGPLIYLRDADKFPLSLGLFALNVAQGNDWTLIMAGNLLMTVPVILMFFFFQRYFIQGVTVTGMKG